MVLEVKPLPDEGRPDLFNGMVGEYAIHVDAEPTTVHVGEPVTLTITVTASNYMESISLGPLRDQPLLADRFEIPSERSLPRLEGKSKIYTQTIRPLSTLSSEIPPLRLVHFSPAAETYVTAESLPIPLTVLPAEEIGFSGAGTYPRSLHTVEGGIRHNYEKPDMLQNRRLLLFGTRLAVALAILLIPPLTAGGISLFSLVGRRRHHIYRTAKAARAYKVFRKNAAHIVLSHSMKSEIYRDLDRVLRAYLGDRLHLTPGALSFRDAAVRLRESGTDSDTLAELQQLFELCEAYRFTRGYDEKADAKEIVRNAARIVKAVERKLK